MHVNLKLKHDAFGSKEGEVIPALRHEGFSESCEREVVRYTVIDKEKEFPDNIFTFLNCELVEEVDYIKKVRGIEGFKEYIKEYYVYRNRFEEIPTEEDIKMEETIKLANEFNKGKEEHKLFDQHTSEGQEITYNLPAGAFDEYCEKCDCIHPADKKCCCEKSETMKILEKEVINKKLQKAIDYIINNTDYQEPLSEEVKIRCYPVIEPSKKKDNYAYQVPQDIYENLMRGIFPKIPKKKIEKIKTVKYLNSCLKDSSGAEVVKKINEIIEMIDGKT